MLRRRVAGSETATVNIVETLGQHTGPPSVKPAGGRAGGAGKAGGAGGAGKTGWAGWARQAECTDGHDGLPRLPPIESRSKSDSVSALIYPDDAPRGGSTRVPRVILRRCSRNAAASGDTSARTLRQCSLAPNKLPFALDSPARIVPMPGISSWPACAP
jgi:hypothetical protein